MRWFGVLSSRVPRLQVRDRKAPDTLLQVFRHQPAVAFLGCRFTAQQATVIQHFRSQKRFNPPRADQREESLNIDLPGSAVLLELVQNLLGRGAFGKVVIIRMADFPEKEPEIIPFREPGELRNVIQPNVKHAANARITQNDEKTLGVLLRESDCEQLDGHAYPHA